ncbi:hypothetical protein Enr13x_51650 [Stieleria neptunia]|uniref:DUF3160 domain-containing protein n=1 Tax=Stieleria neptunia TaxID=2527979 RepID=A0A518HWQ0_9BACT|nr:DUF3160 domain-containing protein [Stieleria neptunia]QDV45289.1 hypothetical protein Enr13x_51650 [Stieleria neptunia]
MMSDNVNRKSSDKTRWLLVGVAGVLGVAWLVFWFGGFSVFGPPPRHLQERWEAGQFDLSDDERQRLRGISVEFDPSNERDADRAIEQTALVGSYVMKREEPVKRREELAVFQEDPTRKVAVTTEEFRHFYQAYANQDHPVFITSDSILNAFHRILEDSILKLEFRQIERLQRLLPILDERLAVTRRSADSEVDRSARRRAQTVIGVARQLIDPSYEPDSEIRRIVQEETERVESGSGQSMPDWLGEPKPSFLAIDYSRFTPMGLHTRSDVLRRHYRSVRWLQTIPFYVGDDEHLLSFRLIAEAADGTNWASFAETYREFFGGTDDWNLQTLNSLQPDRSDSPDSIDTLRSKLLQRLDAKGPPSKINDRVAEEFAPRNSESLSLHVLSAYRTPEAILFQATADWTKTPPSVGLLLCTALGSKLARQRLAESNESESIAKIDSLGRLLDDDSVYGEYLQCLATLLNPIDSSPGFMSTERWQLKSCQTVLGGWTQLRHTFALQAKQNRIVLNQSSHVGAGFVEPNPEFFRRLGRLASRIENSLDELGAFEISYEHMRFRLNESARFFMLIRALEQEGIGINKLGTHLTREDRQFVYDAYEKMGESNPKNWLSFGQLDEELSELSLAAIVQVSDHLERGELPNDRAARGAILRGERSSNRVRWLRLAEICERLGDLASKQLDNQSLTAADEQFITNYGEELAALLNYELHSASDPLDDAMRCVSVLTQANGNHVHIAVARPQAIYVLYPDHGQELLCRGAVFPYFEFTDDAIVDDQSWKTRLDSATSPDRPRWLEPLFTDE